MGYNTTRDPQNTQARWLTDPAVLCFPQAISPTSAVLVKTCFFLSSSMLNVAIVLFFKTTLGTIGHMEKFIKSF
jgi:hypothetical protein